MDVAFVLVSIIFLLLCVFCGLIAAYVFSWILKLLGYVKLKDKWKIKHKKN